MTSRTRARHLEPDHLEHFARLARRHLTASLDQLFSAATGDRSNSSPSNRHSSTMDGELVRTYERLRNASQALMIWHSRDAFLRPDGAPKPLRLSGRHSLSALAKCVSRRPTEIKQIGADLYRLGLLKKARGGYVPARRSAVFAHRNAISLAYAAKAISRLISTITHNYSGGAMPRFERQVAEVQIRATDLPLFLRFVEQQGQYLIDAVDDWLNSRQAAVRTSDKCVSVGIGAFAWLDDARPRPV